MPASAEECRWGWVEELSGTLIALCAACCALALDLIIGGLKALWSLTGDRTPRR